MMWVCSESGRARWLWAGALAPALPIDGAARREAEIEAAKECAQIGGERGHSGAAAACFFDEGKGPELIWGSAHALFGVRPERPLSPPEAAEALERIGARMREGLKSLGCAWAEPMSEDEIQGALRFQLDNAEALGRRALALGEKAALAEAAASARAPMLKPRL